MNSIGRFIVRRPQPPDMFHNTQTVKKKWAPGFSAAISTYYLFWQLEDYSGKSPRTNRRFQSDYQIAMLFSAELSVLLLIGIECGWTPLADSLSADHKPPVYFIVYRLQRKVDRQDSPQQFRFSIFSGNRKITLGNLRGYTDIFRMRRNPCGGNLRGCFNIKKLHT